MQGVKNIFLKDRLVRGSSFGKASWIKVPKGGVTLSTWVWFPAKVLTDRNFLLLIYWKLEVAPFPELQSLSPFSQLRLEGTASVPAGHAAADSPGFQRLVDLSFDPELDFNCIEKTIDVTEIVYDQEVSTTWTKLHFMVLLSFCFSFRTNSMLIRLQVTVFLFS